MWNEDVKSRQLWAWTGVALTGPIAHFAGSGSWTWTAVLGTGCAALCYLVQKFALGKGLWPKWLCGLEYLWIVYILGTVAAWSGDCWKEVTAQPVVPLTLLLLAACAVWGGAERGSRVGCVLCWFLVLLYGLILAAGSRGIRLPWLKPRWDGLGVLVPVFLIPAVVIFLPGKRGPGAALMLSGMVVFAVAVSVWTVGSLSLDVAMESYPAFYEFSKSLSLFGVAERFESFVSVAMTLGYFSLLSLLTGAAGHLAEGLTPGRGRAGILGAVVIAGAVCLFYRSTDVWFLTLGCILFWAVLPILVLWLHDRKKSKKTEKRA